MAGSTPEVRTAMEHQACDCKGVDVSSGSDQDIEEVHGDKAFLFPETAPAALSKVEALVSLQGFCRVRHTTMLPMVLTSAFKDALRANRD